MTYKDNDGERLYRLSQKTFNALNVIAKKRKASRKRVDDEEISKEEHYKNVTKLYAKLVKDITDIAEDEIVTIVTEGITEVCQEVLPAIYNHPPNEGANRFTNGGRAMLNEKKNDGSLSVYKSITGKLKEEQDAMECLDASIALPPADMKNVIEHVERVKEETKNGKEGLRQSPFAALKDFKVGS